jgi:competence protein ComFC
MLRKYFRSFVNLIYPPICLHCKQSLNQDNHLLCEACLAILELADPSERCLFCFSPESLSEQQICSECLIKPPILNGMAAAFDYVGPSACLVRKLKYSDQAFLAKGCGGYLAAQFLRLEWPIPDVIIPVPITFTHWLERGYNQSHLIALTLSEIIKSPVQDSLIRKSGDYSQAGLSNRQRVKLEGKTIQLKKNQSLQDKCILLIDDVMTTGSTMHKCAEALLEDCPASIYGLAVCRSIKRV